MTRSTGSADVPIRHPSRLFIGGEWVEPSSDATIDVIEPATEHLYFRVAAASRSDMERAVTAARAAFDKGPWPAMPHAERADYLRALAAGIRQRRDELSRIWTSEMGVLHTYASAATPRFADVFDYYASFADSFPFVERHTPTAGGSAGFLIREPVGVVAAIVPWNGALALIAYKTAPALIAGCTIVVKASPEAPGEAYVIAEIAESIGLPAGVLNVVTADRDVSELLVRDPRVDKVTFTGSTAVGRRIAAIVGERIGRYTLELGGKSAAVMLDDCEPADLAASIAAIAPTLAGQVCASLTRVVVPRNRHDEVVDALAAAFADIAVGDPFDPESRMGPLVTARHRERVEGYIRKGCAEGAMLVTGGGRPPDLPRGFYVQPTLFAGVDNNSTIAQEEIFGPVVSVIPAADEDDAVRIANDTIYGLNASVFTRDVDRAISVARRLRSGTVGHNGKRNDFGIAFGGVKQSGVGREGGREGIVSFLEAKTVVLDAVPSSVQEDVGGRIQLGNGGQPAGTDLAL